MKLYKKTAAVLTAFVIGVVPFFAEAPLAYDSELSVYDSSAPDKDKEGCYEIYTADQLAWLAVRCNVDHETDFKAKIMQDIEFNPGEVNSKDESRRKWTPIGSGDVNFVGEIDGQGHKITGLYCTGGKLAGLVGYNHGIIKNLGIENSYIFSTTDSSGLAYSGSFAAVTKDGGYIENCYSNARVGSNYISGGLSGVIGGSANLKNCYYSGTVSAKSKAMAGAAAYRADGVAQVINCYYLKNGDELAVAKTAEQFASGEVAYLLNSGGGTFYQNIDNGAEKDAFPVLDPSHGKVYLKNGVYTNGGEQKTTTTETTTETTTQTVTQDAGDGFVYGAAMAESKLTASDAAMILQKVLDGNVVMPIEKKTGDYLKYVDVDADKNLTASDAAMVLQKVLDEKYKFPAEK